MKKNCADMRNKYSTWNYNKNNNRKIKYTSKPIDIHTYIYILIYICTYAQVDMNTNLWQFLLKIYTQFKCTWMKYENWSVFGKCCKKKNKKKTSEWMCASRICVSELKWCNKVKSVYAGIHVRV